MPYLGATPPPRPVTTNDIADGTVQTADIANNAITSVKIADGTVQTADIANNTITSAKLSGDLTAPGDLIVTDNFITDVGTVTASTTQTQAGGLALTTDNVLISTCANQGDSVVLPSAVAGRSVWITNSGAEAAWVWPASGDAINEGTTDARDPAPLWPNESREYRAHDATGFYTPRPAGQRVLLDTQTASASSSLDFTTGVAGFEELILTWRIAELRTTGAFGIIQFRNVSTWRTSGYVYSGHQGDQISGATYNGIDHTGPVTTGFPFLWDDYGGGKDTGTGDAVIRQFDDSAAKTVCFVKSIGEDQGGLMNWIDAKGAYNTNETHNGIRVTTTSGNLDGVFFLFGVNWS